MSTNQRPTRSATWQALALVGELGYLIALPLVAFAILGRWIDRHYQVSPWGLLGGVVVSIVLTTILLIRKFTSLLKDINDQTEQK